MISSNRRATMSTPSHFHVLRYCAAALVLGLFLVVASTAAAELAPTDMPSHTAAASVAPAPVPVPLATGWWDRIYTPVARSLESRTALIRAGMVGMVIALFIIMRNKW
jgi:hypothetical protein